MGRRDDMQLASEGNILQWAVVSSEGTLFVVFKGTDRPMDAIVNMGFLSCDARSASHIGHDVGNICCLRVLSGMWLAFEQSGRDVIGEILAKLERTGVAGRSIVLCGHSLGGGYAVLAGLAFLQRGVDVTAVITF